MFFSSLLICFCSNLSNLICSNLSQFDLFQSFLLPSSSEEKEIPRFSKNITSRWKFYDLIAYRQKLILSLIQTVLWTICAFLKHISDVIFNFQDYIRKKKNQWILSLSSNEGLNRVIHFTANGQDVAHFTAIS